MAELQLTEKRKLEQLLGMRTGYVLSFSNRTFSNFMHEVTGRDVYADKYAVRGESKANRLRVFWEVEPPHVVGALIVALVKHAKELNVVGENEESLASECVAIGTALLRASAPSPTRPVRAAGRTVAQSPLPRDVPREYHDALLTRGFRLEALLGSGLSGRVFRASQPTLDRDVAVKFFDNPFACRDPKLRTRFEREARLLASVRTARVPYVLTTGSLRLGEEAVPYYVMQFIRGLPLHQLLAQGRLAPEKAMQYAIHVLEALDAAHRAGVIHRDIAPPNVMVADEEGDGCYLLDFSIGVSTASLGEPRATSKGEQLGRPDYSAPELTSGARECSPASDLYAVGVLLFEMVAGHSRVTAESVAREVSTLDPELSEIVSTACARKLSDRYKSADDFRAKLMTAAKRIPMRRLLQGTALCTSHMCTEANWSPRGYYRGPRVLSSSTDSFCDACGSRLVYACLQCHTPITERPFCGTCGGEIFSVPKCSACGSFLREEDFRNKSETDCSKCREPHPAAPRGNNDDDVPPL